MPQAEQLSSGLMEVEARSDSDQDSMFASTEGQVVDDELTNNLVALARLCQSDPSMLETSSPFALFMRKVKI